MAPSFESAWSGHRNQSEHAAAFSRLCFGAKMPGLDDLCKDLSGLASIPHEPPESRENLPFNECDEVLPDFRDRYDLVQTIWKPRVISYEDQTRWPGVTTALQAAASRLESKTVPRLAALSTAVAHRRRFFDAILLAARNRLVESRIGLRLMEAMRLLQFPAPGDAKERAECSAHLTDLADERESLALDTAGLIRASTFAVGIRGG